MWECIYDIKNPNKANSGTFLLSELSKWPHYKESHEFVPVRSTTLLSVFNFFIQSIRTLCPSVPCSFGREISELIFKIAALQGIKLHTYYNRAGLIIKILVTNSSRNKKNTNCVSHNLHRTPYFTTLDIDARGNELQGIQWIWTSVVLLPA